MDTVQHHYRVMHSFSTQIFVKKTKMGVINYITNGNVDIEHFLWLQPPKVLKIGKKVHSINTMKKNIGHEAETRHDSSTL